MSGVNPARERRRALDRYAVMVGAVGMLCEGLDRDCRWLTEQGERPLPADVDEHVGQAMMSLRNARRELEAVSRGLWARVSEGA